MFAPFETTCLPLPLMKASTQRLLLLLLWLWRWPRRLGVYGCCGPILPGVDDFKNPILPLSNLPGMTLNRQKSAATTECLKPSRPQDRLELLRGQYIPYHFLVKGAGLLDSLLKTFQPGPIEQMTPPIKCFSRHTRGVLGNEFLGLGRRFLVPGTFTNHSLYHIRAKYLSINLEIKPQNASASNFFASFNMCDTSLISGGVLLTITTLIPFFSNSLIATP